MANTINFLTKPLKLIQSLWDKPPSLDSDAAVDNAASLHGVCGWLNSDSASSGGGDWICQAFGQKMPGVVFFVSLGVMLSTAIFLTRYVHRTLATLDALETLIANIERAKLPLPSPFASESVVKKLALLIEESSQNFPPLSEYSSQMRSTVIDLNSDGRFALQNSLSRQPCGLPFLERWTGKTLADTLPNWLTAIGLLTTFLAILLGLQNVIVMPNLEVRGIGSLVNGLSGKFFSSIVSLTSAILVSIVSFFLSQKVNLLWESLTSKIETTLPPLNPETLLLELVRQKRG